MLLLQQQQILFVEMKEQHVYMSPDPTESNSFLPADCSTEF